jgi:hypothetical protein
MSTVQDEILDRIRKQGRGKVFTPKDFLDLGSRTPPTSRSLAWSRRARFSDSSKCTEWRRVPSEAVGFAVSEPDRW